ncbi:MAG TPA: acyl-CoA dehydrogenase family protein [Gemmatimonadaceae bacterium]|nr:acyl-CoA dehydrogenase family protein [Gemmatimonadaceae bacterium]
MATAAAPSAAGLDREMLDLTIEGIRAFAAERLPLDLLLELDARDECPEALVRAMCGPELGVHLLFIPECYDGMGGGAFDVYRVCETLASIDLGVATGVLATFLGSDPLVFGGTEAQRAHWLGRIAREGLLMAYGATEPEAGSDLGALRTTATPVHEDGVLTGYRLNGAKMWISNGGIADLYSVLAQAPGGPSWFVVERGAAGLTHGKPEDKHGIRASNTAALALDDVLVPVEQLIGGVEGQGLVQAQMVFGYTRLMVAAFGLGAGWAALDRAIDYSTTRVQAGGPLSEKQGYTHKLLVPHAVTLEAARAVVEETAERIDGGAPDGSLNTEGAIAKYLASEAGVRAADAAVQALGGYGYVREYVVEKIRRDVRITTIYEGTSEILEMTIARDRWQLHLKTRGGHYHDLAREMEALHAGHADVGADRAALALHALAELLERARVLRLTRGQHVLLRLGSLIAQVEGAAALARRAARHHDGLAGEKADARFTPPVLAAISRVNAREAAQAVALEALRLVCGADEARPEDAEPFERALGLSAIVRAQAGRAGDLDAVRDALYAGCGTMHR